MSSIVTIRFDFIDLPPVVVPKDKLRKAILRITIFLVQRMGARPIDGRKQHIRRMMSEVAEKVDELSQWKLPVFRIHLLT